MIKKAIIFDLDGTLWNTTDATVLSYNQVLKRNHLEEVSKQKVCDNFGNNREQAIQHFFPSMSPDLAYKILDQVDEVIIKNLHECSDTCIYDGLEEELELLTSKYELFIVSNCSHNTYIEAFLNTRNLKKYFKSYIAAPGLSLLKYEAILKVIKDNEISHAIYVGDTDKDKKAAEKANVPFIQCLYGFGNDLNCTYKIQNISELSNIVEKVFDRR